MFRHEQGVLLFFDTQCSSSGAFAINDDRAYNTSSSANLPPFSKFLHPPLTEVRPLKSTQDRIIRVFIPLDDTSNLTESVSASL